MKKIILIILMITGSFTMIHGQDLFNSLSEVNTLSNKDILQNTKASYPLETANQALYDVYFYSIDVKVYREEQKISGRVLIFAHTLSALGHMELNFAGTQVVHGVYLAEYPDSSLVFQHQEDMIDIQLDKEYDAGEEVKIMVDYTAFRIDWGMDFMKYEGLDIITTWRPERWWPLKFVVGDKADSCDIKVTVPDDLVVGSNGVLKEIIKTDTTSTYYWQERYPVSPLLMAFSAGPYEIHDDWYVNASKDSLKILIYTIPSVYEQLKETYALDKEMLAFFEDNFGPYPYFREKYGHLEQARDHTMEHQTMTFLSIPNVLNNGESLLAHELSHSWFSSCVTEESFHHAWIVEGFAKYAAVLWQLFKYNLNFKDISGTEYYGPGTVYVEHPDYEDVWDNNLAYVKGAWVYHMLRHIVGDSVYFSTIKEITSGPEYAYGTINTEELKEEFESGSGLDLDKYFQQWIMGEYYPEYSCAWDYEKKEQGYELELTLDQVQSGQLFWMPLDVAVETAGGVENFVIWDSLESQVFHLALNDKPLSVKLDPDNWVMDKNTIINPEPPYFYLDDNDVTIKCLNGHPGDTGTLNGITCEAVDRELLEQKIKDGGDLSKLCTSLVAEMDSLFYGLEDFNQDIGSWDVSNVTDMSGLFSGASSFNQDIRWWNVSGVRDMKGMFSNSSFNRNIGFWDVSNVTNMDGMFSDNTSFNQDLSHWCIEKITVEPKNFATNCPLEKDYYPVWGTCLPYFYLDENGVTIKCFNSQPGETGTLNNITYEAVDRDLLIQRRDNGFDLTELCTSLVFDMSELFAGKSEFNQDIGSWDVSNVTDMRAMFSGASGFNQYLGYWDVSHVTNMNNMFYNAGSFNSSLVSWCVRNITSEPASFARNSALDSENYPVWGTCPELPSVGIRNLSENELRIYPNPFSETLIIETSGQQILQSIELFDLTGKVLRMFDNVNSSRVEINRGGLSSGIYILKIEAGEILMRKVAIK